LLTLNSEGPRSRAQGNRESRLLALHHGGEKQRGSSVIAFYVAVVATDLTPVFVAGLSV
jgi:hypothetical protein